jgi:alcohol dehydrogenase class IV
LSYRFVTADQTLLLGVDIRESLPAELASRQLRRVCIVSTPRASISRGAARVREALARSEVIRFIDDVREHSPIVDTERWASQLRNDAPDALIAIGGGSASDTAKAIAILLAEGGRLEQHCSSFTPPDQLEAVDLPNAKLPVIAVPTTLAGAEITPGGGATNQNGVKRVFWDPKVASRVVLFDPAAIADVPVGILLTTGMNGLAHCAEGLYSRTQSPLSSALAAQGASDFAEGLIALASHDRDVDATFAKLQVAAAIGGLVISNARVGMHHALCHVLGASLGLAHGVANAVMLPYVLEFNYAETKDAQERFADALRPALASRGLPVDGSPAKITMTLQRAIGVPSSLRSVGISEHDLDGVAKEVMQDRGLFFNPRPVRRSTEPLAVLQNAWAGILSEDQR